MEFQNCIKRSFFGSFLPSQRSDYLRLFYDMMGPQRGLLKYETSESSHFYATVISCWVFFPLIGAIIKTAFGITPLIKQLKKSEYKTLDGTSVHSRRLDKAFFSLMDLVLSWLLFVFAIASLGSFFIGCLYILIAFGLLSNLYSFCKNVSQLYSFQKNVSSYKAGTLVVFILYEAIFRNTIPQNPAIATELAQQLQYTQLCRYRAKCKKSGVTLLLTITACVLIGIVLNAPPMMGIFIGLTLLTVVSTAAKNHLQKKSKLFKEEAIRLHQFCHAQDMPKISSSTTQFSRNCAPHHKKISQSLPSHSHTTQNAGRSNCPETKAISSTTDLPSHLKRTTQQKPVVPLFAFAVVQKVLQNLAQAQNSSAHLTNQYPPPVSCCG